MVRKKYLICIDSDGCAMDTMNSKHEKCFGPAMIEMWGLESRKEEAMKCWNRVNLFSGTRGINRFPALCMVLEELLGKKENGERSECAPGMEGFQSLKTWTEETKELSLRSLEEWTKEHDFECCRRACRWSRLVNEKIAAMPKEGNKAFPGVRKALSQLHEYADIAVVSSANRAAVEEEWNREGLLPWVDVLMTQEDGSKKDCIARMLEKGYDKNHVLMVGDAPGDLKAAKENGVLFYPILAGREEISWENLKHAALKPLLDGSYGDGTQQETEFWENLNQLEKCNR